MRQNQHNIIDKKTMPSLTSDLIAKALFDGTELSDYPVFIETGTFGGRTLEALASSFEQLFSIDIDINAIQQASTRLRGKKNVRLIRGDSVEMLPKLLKIIDRPVIIYLDAHYNGTGSPHGAVKIPIYEELRAIMTEYEPPCIVIIDDFRLFGKIGGRGDDWRQITEKQATDIVRPRLRGVKYLPSPECERDRLVFQLGARGFPVNA
jgi:hypothetical protein